MIRAEVGRSGGRIVRLHVHGHAGTAPYGEDLVCAAVSAVVQTAALGLARLDRMAAAARVRDGDLSWQGESGEAGQVILETCVLGLQDIAASYPGAIALVVKEDERP